MGAAFFFIDEMWKIFLFLLGFTFKSSWGGRYGVALMYNSKVAQPAHRVKDKRLRRAFGILDTARWLGFMTIKGLLPTPVKQG